MITQLIVHRASTATIIRIPFIRGLANQGDFLYATTDVAIWSTVETGIGITASAIATLRPLFRTFFSRNRLLGGTSTPAARPYLSHPHNASGPNAYGSARSKNRGGIEELALTSQAAKGIGITTVIESPRGTEMLSGMNNNGKMTSGPLDGANGWGHGDGKVTDISSDEEERVWQNRAIRKTTDGSQVYE